MTRLKTNRRDDGLASVENTNRKISHRHRRWSCFTKGHHKTSTIGHRREITKETWTNGMDNTKTLKDRLHIIVGDFEWKVTIEDEADTLVSGGNRDRDIPKEESRSLKEIVLILGGLGGYSDSVALQKLHSIDLFSIQGSQQLWGNL